MGWCTAALAKQYVYRLHASLAVMISRIALAHWQSYSAGNTAASQKHVHDRRMIGKERGNSLPVVLNKCRNSSLKKWNCVYFLCCMTMSFPSQPTLNTCCSEPLCSVHAVLIVLRFSSICISVILTEQRECPASCVVVCRGGSFLVNISCLVCFIQGTILNTTSLHWAEIEWYQTKKNTVWNVSKSKKLWSSCMKKVKGFLKY